MRIQLASSLLLLTASSAFAAASSPRAQDSVAEFHAALERGDRAAVLRLLLPDVVIFESGDIRLTRDEYAARDLATDIEFSTATKEEVLSRSAAETGDVAWVLTRSHTKGSFHNHEIDAHDTETMLLRRTSDGWRIFHIHRSSHPAQ